MHCLRADIYSLQFSPVFSSTISYSKMYCRWRVITLGAVLWLVIVLLSLDEVRGKLTAPRTHGEDVPQSQMNWCEKTKVCTGCAESKRPRCLGDAEPPLGGDICGCCLSCVAIRDSGESCGSQLSVWPVVSEAGPVSSSVTILATSWCRDGLVCVNFVCLDFDVNVKPATSPWLRTDEGFAESRDDHVALNVFGQDMTTLDVEATLPTAELYQRITAPLWKPILVNHDDPDLPKTVSSTPNTPIPSSTVSLTESRKKPQPCYAESEETMTISSYPSDDLLGRVATTTLNGSRFQLVYAGELLSELKVLLNVVDKLHQDTLLDERSVDSLLDGFVDLSSHPDGGLLLGHQDDDKVMKPSIADSQKILSPREKRELEITEEDVVGYEAPENIQDLIRSASAHREYVDMARGNDQNTNILNKNKNEMPAGVSSQEDESTVRVHITNRPRKVQTLIDLEEDEEEEEIDDEERRNLQLVNRGHAQDARKLSPLSDEPNGVPPVVQTPLGPTITPRQNVITKETAKLRPADIPQVVNALWNESLMTLSDRLMLVEVRIGIFERVLEELAKWCNLGVLSMTRDCLVPQVSDIRYGQWGTETDEHLAVASGIDPVRIPENRRKSGGNIPRRDGYHDIRTPVERSGIFSARKTVPRGKNEQLNPNFFRTINGNGYPRRSSTSGHQGTGRIQATSSCRNHGSRRSSLGQQIAGTVHDPPVHRTVQRSVLMTNPSSSNSPGLERRTNVDQTMLSDTQPNQTVQETQIPVPTTLAEKVTIRQDLEKRDSSSPLEDIFPQGWVSTTKITSSSSIPSGKTSVLDEKSKENEEEWRSFPRMKSGLGKLGLQRNGGRRKRSMERINGILPTHDTLRKIRTESSVETRRAGKLFERETTASKGLEHDITGNMWPGAIIVGNDEHEEIARSLFANGTSEFRNSPESIARRLLFRHSDLLKSAESSAKSISINSQNAQKVLDQYAEPYSITNNENSTIRIEKINETKCEDSLPQTRGSLIEEDDFDHIYESVGAENEDEDFEYDIAYDQVEYVDGSTVEIVSEVPPKLQESKAEFKPVIDLSKDGIHSVLFPHERSRRTPRKEDDQCESRRQAKREMPLLLLGSTGKHEPKTIVWPSKWIGYRKDRLLRAERSGNDETGLNSRSSATRSSAITTTLSPPSRTTESLIIGYRFRNGETNHVIRPKIFRP